MTKVIPIRDNKKSELRSHLKAIYKSCDKFLNDQCDVCILTFKMSDLKEYTLTSSSASASELIGLLELSKFSVLSNSDD